MTTPSRLAVLFCVAFGLMTSQAAAATRYVSPSGSGTACTQAAPCGSMDQAYRTAAPGDTVRLAAGTYGGQSIAKDATKPLGSAPVVFQAAGATLAGFTTRANDVQYFDLNVPSDVVLVRAGQNVLIARARAQKPYIWGPRPGIDPGDRIDNVTIRDGNFGPHTSCEGGFQITADGPPRNVKIIGNYFHDFRIDQVACPTAHLDCMHVFNGIDGLTVSGNRFARCEHFGMLLNGSSNVVVENNFFSGGIYGFKLRGDTDPSWEQFNNVVIRNNSADEISLGSDGSNTLTNVRVENNATVDYVQCRTGATFVNNLAQRGGRCSGDFANVASIGFADVGNGDFHITSTSPAANRVPGGPATDFDGDPRPQGSNFEVGADELVDGGSPPSPPPPPPACGDGLDNDGDLLVDMLDPGCSSTTDTDETNAIVAPPPPPPPACGDGLDNDGDLLVDMLDPGCSSTTDTDETNTITTPKGRKKPPKPRLAVSVWVPTEVSVSPAGVLKVRVACRRTSVSAAKRCAGRLLVLRAKAAAASSQRRVLGRARFRIRAGHAKVVRVRLSRRALASSTRRYVLRVKMRGAARNVRVRRTG